MAESPSSKDLLEWTTMIVSSHVGKTPSSTDDVSSLIKTVHKALSGLSSGAEPNLPEPAVPVRRSVTPDYIVCLEDGRKLKMLKRHLSTAYSMTPDEYRERWNLPADYPMVAPNYARQRSNLAKKIGLGTKRSRG
ncbi:MAG: MucR family transcriptional regulator [Rhodospirillales bacterium]|nr:MucR family transcriptional regulator [Rhodospirillales bacterium]